MGRIGGPPEQAALDQLKEIVQISQAPLRSLDSAAFSKQLSGSCPPQKGGDRFRRQTRSLAV